MASPSVIAQISTLKEDSFEIFEKPGSTFQEFYRVLALFPALLEQYNREIHQIGQSFMGGYTEPAIASAKNARYQAYRRFLQQLKQMKATITPGPGYSTNGVASYSHNMTPAGMRAAAARRTAHAAALGSGTAVNAEARAAASRTHSMSADLRLDAARANIREMEARAARRAREEAAARVAAISNATRIREARGAALREAAAEAAVRNTSAREAAAAAANKNKIRPPLNFWMRTNGVRVGLEDIEKNKKYILLETNFDNDNDDVFLIQKIGDTIYKIGTYTTDANKIVYERMVQEQVMNTANIELYKFPDPLQSGSARKSRNQWRNRRNRRKSKKSRN
jgi:hypothetical protein